MNRDDYMFALSERDNLIALINHTPDDDIISKMSLESRLYEINELLEEVKVDTHPPVKATITFRGGPVLGTYGIAANFGSKVVSAFSDAVSLVASSFSGKLPPKGRVPNIEDNLLMITGTAKGSFGFTLEEFRPDTPLLFDEESSVSKALDQTHFILQTSMSGDDDALADALSDLDSRALDKIRSFVQILIDHKSLFSLRHKDFSLAAKSIHELEISAQKLSSDSVKEELKELEVVFIGALPHKRQCEFMMADDDKKDILAAKISSFVNDPGIINDHRGMKVKAKFLCTQVGEAKTKYSLRELPDWK